MAKYNYDVFNEKFKNGNDFSVNRKQYLKLVGRDIPQDKYYMENHSAVSKRAKEFGFTVEVIPEKIMFHKKGDEPK